MPSLKFGKEIAQTGLNFLLANENRKRALQDQKEIANFNYDLEMKKWNATNYGAQVKHMKDAGLSISNMYGGSGASGSTANSNTAGGGIQMGGRISPMDIANLDLMKSQAEKNRAEAKAIVGDESTGRGGKIGILTQEYEKLLLENRVINADWIHKYDLEVKQMQKDVLFTDAKIKATDAQKDKFIADVDKMAADILRDKKQLDINAGNLDATLDKLTNDMNIALEKNQNAIYVALINQGGSILKDIIRGSFLKGLTKRKSTWKSKNGGDTVTETVETFK
jgi:hypothetical protein